MNIEKFYHREYLIDLDIQFLDFISSEDENLYHSILEARSIHKNANSDLIIELSFFLEDFIATIFPISEHLCETKDLTKYFSILYKCKRNFVQRYAIKKYPDPNILDRSHFHEYLSLEFNEKQYIERSLWLLENFEECPHELEALAKYTSWVVKFKPETSLLFQVPQKIDFQNLVSLSKDVNGNISSAKCIGRDGFDLTCPKPSFNEALNQANYCVFCHQQNRDSCSKGMLNSDQTIKTSPLNIPLHGCPLKEKISEMNLAKANGGVVGPLAIVMIDNPLCPFTGYKICNDCSKSCIYQKQSPVDIPSVETRVLEDVLNLPYGFEIYSLLTRWNPLNFDRPLPNKETGKNILIAGLGPAGANLAHHLLNDGHTILAIDGLKIEPLPPELSGITQDGKRVPFIPIKNVEKQLYEKLSERLAWGFGGVSEYGITSRWDKNYLKIIRLVLERRKNFMMLGGVRLGSNLTIKNAFDLGFHHVALAMGSGKPNLIEIGCEFDDKASICSDVPLASQKLETMFGLEKSKQQRSQLFILNEHVSFMARGVRLASDFLMALQLTGAAKFESIANLQIRMPVVIIGGGLTAVDAATEALAYYPVQVQKFYLRYQLLCKNLGQEKVRNCWTAEENAIADEFIEHAIALNRINSKIKKVEFLKSIGGAKIAYRGKLISSPAYRLNSEELSHALSEGVEFVENAIAIAVVKDKYGYVSGLRLSNSLLPAKTVIIATGTSSNAVINLEEPEYINDFSPVDLSDFGIKTQKAVIYNNNGKSISFFGDMRSEYRGSVVKAMASSKDGYPIITKLLESVYCSSIGTIDFFETINKNCRAKIVTIDWIADHITEIVVESKLAAENFYPGQFFKFQNFEINSDVIKYDNCEKTNLSMEGVALTGSFVDKKSGFISLIILKVGGSSNLFDRLKIGEYINLMGPTGAPTEIPENETVLLIGGGLGNAVLFSIGGAMLKNGCKVLYCAGYKKKKDLFKMSSIESASTQVLWACEEELIVPRRSQDRSFCGNIIDAILDYATTCSRVVDRRHCNFEEGKIHQIMEENISEAMISLSEVDRIIVIGSDGMMNSFNEARKTKLAPYLKKNHKAFASINSPMQCMMKEVCGQCLQRHIDPLSGKERFVYTCTNQDQSMELVDFSNLSDRLGQNSLQEKLTKEWVEFIQGDVV